MTASTCTPVAPTRRTTPPGTRPPGTRSAATERAYGFAVEHAPSAGFARVVLELRRCWRKYGKVTPSVLGTAERARVSTATVKRATRWLRGLGMLTVITRRAHCKRDGTWGRSQTNMYVMHWPTTEARRAWSHRGITRDPSMSSRTVEPPLVGAAVLPAIDEGPIYGPPRLRESDFDRPELWGFPSWDDQTHAEYREYLAWVATIPIPAGES